MKRTIILFMLIHLLPLGWAFGQVSEKINLYISGGTALPQESFIGSQFNFTQLNEGTGSNFAEEFLKIENSPKNFNDYWKTGFSLGSGLEYRLNQILSALVEFNYHNFHFNKEQLEADFRRAIEDPNIVGLPFNESSFELTQGSTNMYSLTLNIKVGFPLEMISTYVVAGGGYLRVQSEALNISYYDEPLSQEPVAISFYDRIDASSEDALVVNAGGGIIFNIFKNARPYVQASYAQGFTDPYDTKLIGVKFGFVFSFQ
ncbi:MAG: hypothetical protein Kow0042_02590 [Calditrichia bacterium]